jgi:hypothetical protein
VWTVALTEVGMVVDVVVDLQRQQNTGEQPNANAENSISAKPCVAISIIATSSDHSFRNCLQYRSSSKRRSGGMCSSALQVRQRQKATKKTQKTSSIR